MASPCEFTTVKVKYSGGEAISTTRGASVWTAKAPPLAVARTPGWITPSVAAAAGAGTALASAAAIGEHRPVEARARREMIENVCILMA